MILIAVGTTGFPMRRMAGLASEIVRSRKRNERVVFQHGATATDITGPGVTIFAEEPFEKFAAHIAEARVIVSHGGPATIYQALAVGKVPWVLPRDPTYGEHVNDHQMHFVSDLARQGVVWPITDRTTASAILSGSAHASGVIRKEPDPAFVKAFCAAIEGR